METPGRGHNGKFERTIDTAQRDGVAARLKAEGKSYQEIADQLGYENRSGAFKAVKRALAQVVIEPAEELRKVALARLDEMASFAREVMLREHLTVSHGHVVRRQIGIETDEDGIERLDADGHTIPVYEPILDDGPTLAAIDRLAKIEAARWDLLGLKAPVQVDATVTQVTQADIELAQLVAEQKARNAMVEQALRGES